MKWRNTFALIYSHGRVFWLTLFSTLKECKTIFDVFYLGHVIHANHARVEMILSPFFFYLLRLLCSVGICVPVHSRHSFSLAFVQNKHVKCSKYSNLSGEILFLSAFVYVITLDMKCLNCSFQPCGLLFFFIHFSSFFLSFFSFYCKYIISTRKREKNYGKFPLNKTYNPNNFCARAKYARIYITKRLNADGWMDGEIIHLQKFNGLCMVWRIVRKMPHE